MNQIEEQREKSRRHFFIVMWVLICISALALINKEFNKPTDITKTAEYQQGYKDALYKRPVSDDLEMVCAGLWIGKEDLKYQQREMKK